MPELSELKIMSDYINHHSKDRTFTKLYHVEKGNIPVDSNLIENFKVESISNGKELILPERAKPQYSYKISTDGKTAIDFETILKEMKEVCIICIIFIY